MEELLGLPHPPDAVFAANNLIGLGALRVLPEHGLTPPTSASPCSASSRSSSLSPTA